jgi:hypothetical protein
MGRYADRMATRKAPRKAASNSGRLVPALRDAVEVIDRALEALGSAPKKKRVARRKPRQA